jgi:hypothetical protein
MQTKNVTEPFLQWSFHLVDDPPGPSISEAAEFVGAFGFDPLTFSLKQGAELRTADVVVTEFEVSGPNDLVRDLRTAHDRRTGSRTREPQAVQADTDKLVQIDQL